MSSGAPRRPRQHELSHLDPHVNRRHGRYPVTAPAPITVTPIFVADLLAEDERMPVYVHVIDHPDARVLVDTGMTELHPAVADLDPRLRPLSEQDLDLAGIDIVVSTHLHFDHCGGNHLFAGRPIYVQRRDGRDERDEEEDAEDTRSLLVGEHSSNPFLGDGRGTTPTPPER